MKLDKTQGIKAISPLLPIPSKMVELDIGNNEFDQNAVISIMDTLNYKECALKVLNIDNPYLKSIKQEAAVQIAKMLKPYHFSLKISLKNTNFAAAEFTRSLKTCSKI